MTSSTDRLTAAVSSRSDRPVLITGGSGFIGANLAHAVLSQGRDVVLYDDLSRPGVHANAGWLQRQFGARVRLIVADTRDADSLAEAVSESVAVFHFAAQVAVTSSLCDPVHDFAVNVQGTLNLLEALRALACPPPLLFTSTNKVYGDLSDLALEEEPTRVVPCEHGVHQHGVSEQRCLDFHSPYGCSKGAADQYVLDYARSYGLPAMVFRMSCIYGPRQFGTEDQGWVAHFLIRALERRAITLYGDGKQVRDVLFISDLTAAMLLAERHMGALSGQAFNIGGGPDNTLSLIELVEMIRELTGERPEVEFAATRTGDQRYYVSNTEKFGAATGWSPKVAYREGVEQLWRWLEDERGGHRFRRAGRLQQQVAS